MKTKNFELIVPMDDEDSLIVKVTEGDLKGLVFKYGDVTIENLAQKSAKVQYEYNILENPNNLEEDDKLFQTLGDMFFDIIEDVVEPFSKTIGLDEIDEKNEMFEQFKKEYEAITKLREGNDGSDDRDSSS